MSRALLPGSIHDGRRETPPSPAAPRVVRPAERFRLRPARPYLVRNAKAGCPGGGVVNPDGHLLGINIHYPD